MHTGLWRVCVSVLSIELNNLQKKIEMRPLTVSFISLNRIAFGIDHLVIWFLKENL